MAFGFITISRRVIHLGVVHCFLLPACVAQPAPARHSEAVHDLLINEPAAVRAGDDDAARQYAHELACAADTAKAQGLSGYTGGWRRAADLAQAHGEREFAEALYMQIALEGEDADARAGGYLQLVQWCRNDVVRVRLGEQAIANIEHAGPYRVRARIDATTVMAYTKGLQGLGRYEDAVAARARARERIGQPPPDALRYMAQLDLGDAHDLVRLGREAEGVAAFERAFQTDPALRDEPLAPAHALAFCQQLCPAKFDDPRYESVLLAQWNRPEIRRHPLAVYLASQAAINMRTPGRRADFEALAAEVLAEIPAWRASQAADRRRAAVERDSLRTHLSSIAQRAASHHLDALRTALEAARDDLTR